MGLKYQTFSKKGQHKDATLAENMFNWWISGRLKTHIHNVHKKCLRVILLSVAQKPYQRE